MESIQHIFRTAVAFSFIFFAVRAPLQVQPAQATPPTPVPDSPPLILLWQADQAPDDFVINPTRVALDKSGNCYVGNSEGAPVKKFDKDGKYLGSWGSKGTGDGQLAGQTGIAVDSQDNLYVANFDDGKIQKFDSRGNFILKWFSEAPTGPAGLAIDSKDNVYVANHRTHDHYIQKFDSQGNLLAQWGSTGTTDGQFGAGARSGPEMLAIDKDDNIYVTDPDHHRVQKFDANGKFLAKFGTLGVNGHGEMDLPFAIAVDGKGNIYVNDGHFLQKFNPQGKPLAQWSTSIGISSADSDLDQAGHFAVTEAGDIYILARASVKTAIGTFDLPILKKFKQP
jgi:DNA-binding beta-propeller fold protein YncE